MADQAYSQAVGANGVATIQIKVTNGISRWIISQVSAELPSAPAGATCELRKNTNLVTPMIATGDTAGGEPPVDLLGSDVLTVTWTGCTPGTIAKAFIFFEEVAR